MPTYLVWDDVNETEETSARIEASCAQGAAELYAEHDVDGNIAGIYNGVGGHPIRVKREGGESAVWLVQAEYEPSYHASKTENAGARK